MPIATILAIINGAAKLAPEAVAIVNAIKPLFNGADQTELQSALDEAVARSDAAQADFVAASRGG